MDINTAKDIIRAAALADDTVIMEGVHGIGKSDIAKQVQIEDGYHLETLFLSHQETGDLTGIPRMATVNDVHVTLWSVPIWLQRMREYSWPRESKFTDLIFHDKEFEEFVKHRLDM
jgi:MoxR-like ATPase